MQEQTGRMTAVVATWNFSQCGVETAAKALGENKTALDAVQQGIFAVEEDETVTSVGYGGLPNAEGFLQLDAALMASDGRAGAVMAVERFRGAIPLARLVLDHCPHTVLAGDGVSKFAENHGMQPLKEASSLLTPHAQARYRQFLSGTAHAQLESGTAEMAHTDTVGMIALDASGSLAAGCATSGMQFKAVGRVGDSPIIGAGLYADETGAAVASGDGDTMMRFCISFLVVERMRNGDAPKEACRYAMNRVHASAPTCQAAVVAMSPDGTVGAACTHFGFNVVHWNSKTSSEGAQSFEAPGVAQQQWKHTCV